MSFVWYAACIDSLVHIVVVCGETKNAVNAQIFNLILNIMTQSHGLVLLDYLESLHNRSLSLVI